jgi:hypothetical protein
MSLTLPSHGLRHGEASRTRNVPTAPAQEQRAAETASPQMLVFAWIWLGVIAYFALHAAFN